MLCNSLQVWTIREIYRFSGREKLHNCLFLFNYIQIFTELAPLDQFNHRVAMSVEMCVVLRHQVQLFSRPLMGPHVT